MARNLFQPTLPQVILLLILLSLSTIILTDKYATTKVTYEERRGIPFTVFTIAEVRYGPCEDVNSQCVRRVSEVYFANFFLNALILYLAVLLFGDIIGEQRIRSWLRNRYGK